MEKKEIKGDYEHYFKPAKEEPYPEGYSLVLIDTVEKFQQLMKIMENVSVVAVDTETTSLDMTKADVVGMGLCFEDKRSFYLPWGHRVNKEQNLPRELMSEVYDKILKPKKTLWYNFTYDGPVLEKMGFDIEDLDYYDVMSLVWLTDTNKKLPALDWAAGHFLGWCKLTSYRELVYGLEDFSFLSPEDALIYAATDPLATYRLYKLLYDRVMKECPFIVKLDNKLVLALIRGQQEDHLIDGSELKAVEAEVDEHLPKLRDEIYKESGRVFDIGSPAQVSDVLESLGLDTGGRTKSGKLNTRAENLEKLDHPVAMKIIEYKKLSAIKNSFINPLLEYADRRQPCRFKYFAMTTPTGRLSAGRDGKNSYFAGLNIQAIAKPNMVKKYAHYVGEGKGILGWEFSDEPSDRMVEVPDEKRNVRRAFKAPSGFWFVRADYSGQELRIVANHSKEKAWIEAFCNGEDIHGKVCKDVFGEVNSELRNQTKVVNFGIIYGSTPYSFARRFDKSEEEGVQFYADYKEKHRRLFSWIESQKRLARRSGVVYTRFGRPRRLLHYYTSSNPRVRAFADRSSVNSVIQGGGADIFRIGLVNLYNKMYKVYPKDFIFQMGVHDELDSLVRKGKEHLIDEMIEILTVSLKGWEVPLTVSVDIGTSWGDLVSFSKEDGIWVPVSC